ncbi:conserved hypothetical protein, partial [Trichinella spiralis]|uniref:hypothetical protein n=1 Tax=Trichinella spiralis TaxID=6334 RepID=UPI0001EFEDD8
STDLEGNFRRVVLKDTNSIPHVFGLALTSDHLYWTDWTFRGIMRCNKLTGENVTLVAQTALLPYDLKIHQAASQPSAVLDFTADVDLRRERVSAARA